MLLDSQTKSGNTYRNLKKGSEYMLICKGNNTEDYEQSAVYISVKDEYGEVGWWGRFLLRVAVLIIKASNKAGYISPLGGKQMSTSATSHQILASRVFGDFSRFRLVTASTRFGAVEFFLYDAEAGEENGMAAIVAQAGTLEEVLSSLSAAEQDEFLSQRPCKKGQKALNLSRTPVRVKAFNRERGVLVECLRSSQRWYAEPSKLVLIDS